MMKNLKCVGLAGVSMIVVSTLLGGCSSAPPAPAPTTTVIEEPVPVQQQAYAVPHQGGPVMHQVWVQGHYAYNGRWVPGHYNYVE